jgi:hypothetical protein
MVLRGLIQIESNDIPEISTKHSILVLYPCIINFELASAVKSIEIAKVNTFLVDWNCVKKQSLWSYEDLITKLQDTIGYAFVHEHYNHSMPQARDYAIKIRQGYLQNQAGKTGFVDEILANLEKLETHNIGTYSDLIRQIATREGCLAFMQRTGFDSTRSFRRSFTFSDSFCP